MSLSRIIDRKISQEIKQRKKPAVARNFHD